MDYSDLYESFIDYQNVFMESTNFYTRFLKLIKDSPSTFTLIDKRLDRIIESDWVDFVEKAMPSLDKCIRNPRKFIVNREEILPIELSRNITAESIKHLSQHTNLISSVDGDKITPSKILNVFKEESIDTYENKFIYTLLNRLFLFLNRRNDALSVVSDAENYTMLKMEQQIDISNNEKLDISFEIKSSVIDDKTDKTEAKTGFKADVRRVNKLNKVIAEYMSSPFNKEMKQYGYIRPPIMRTNALMKDVDLRKCLDLWLFIESYDNVGYQLDTTDTAKKPPEDYINKLYGITAIEYALFKHYTVKDNDENVILRRVKRKRALVPTFVKDIFDEFTTEFNMDETAFKKLMNNQALKLRKQKSEDEERIKQAIANALKAQKQRDRFEQERKQKEQKEKEKRMGKKNKR